MGGWFISRPLSHIQLSMLYTVVYPCLGVAGIRWGEGWTTIYRGADRAGDGGGGNRTTLKVSTKIAILIYYLR